MHYISNQLDGSVDIERFRWTVLAEFRLGPSAFDLFDFVRVVGFFDFLEGYVDGVRPAEHERLVNHLFGRFVGLENGIFYVRKDVRGTLLGPRVHRISYDVVFVMFFPVEFRHFKIGTEILRRDRDVTLRIVILDQRFGHVQRLVLDDFSLLVVEFHVERVVLGQFRVVFDRDYFRVVFVADQLRFLLVLVEDVFLGARHRFEIELGTVARRVSIADEVFGAAVFERVHFRLFAEGVRFGFGVVVDAV